MDNISGNYIILFKKDYSISFHSKDYNVISMCFII